MSFTRNDLLVKYDIQEEGLKNLIEDLCSKPEDANNLTIIKKALRGCYSDLESTTCDSVNLTISKDFIAAGYDDLPFKAKTGRYDHDFAPKVKPSNPDAINLNREYQNQRLKSINFLATLDPGKTMKELFKDNSATSSSIKQKM